MSTSLGDYENEDKQNILKVMLITIILSADLGKSMDIGNIVFYIATIISMMLIIISAIKRPRYGLKYLKCESVIYISIVIITFFMILYFVDSSNSIHVLKLYLMFFIIYPSIRSFFTAKQIITGLKINLIINFVLVVFGKMGIVALSGMTGLLRGSTVLNYAGSLYKVGLLLIPYLIWDIIKNNENRLINILLLVISMYIILFDGSRTGILSVAIIIVSYILIRIINVIKKMSISPNSLIRNVIFVLIAGILLMKNMERIANTNAFNRGFEFIQLFLKFNVEELFMKGDAIRGNMILDAINSIQANYLIFGNGFGSTTTQGMVIHNAYLQIFADLGIVSVICLIIIVIYPIIIGTKHIKKNQDLIPSVISLIVFAFLLLFHPFSVQVSEWALYLIPLSLIINGIREKR